MGCCQVRGGRWLHAAVSRRRFALVLLTEELDRAAPVLARRLGWADLGGGGVGHLNAARVAAAPRATPALTGAAAATRALGDSVAAAAGADARALAALRRDPEAGGHL
jgi:hypothetical protein